MHLNRSEHIAVLIRLGVLFTQCVYVRMRVHRSACRQAGRHRRDINYMGYIRVKRGKNPKIGMRTCVRLRVDNETVLMAVQLPASS